MLAAASHVRVSDSESFKAASRVLFGPVTQVFASAARPLEPRLVSTHLGTCRLSQIKANAHTVVNDRALRRSFDPDSIKVLVQLRGRSRFEQQSVVLDLGPCSAIIYDPVRTYSLQNLSSIDHLILQVPRSAFDHRMLSSLSTPLSLTEQNSGLARLVSTLMHTAITEAEGCDETCRTRVGESLIHLLHGLVRCGPRQAQHGCTPLHVLKERIICYIDANLSHSDLSPAEIARRMGCSRRYLHRAFEGQGVSLGRFIWERRLERSRDALLSPERSGMSISQIAFACGFNSSAHFSRAFKSKYNVSPSELREEVRNGLRRAGSSLIGGHRSYSVESANGAMLRRA